MSVNTHHLLVIEDEADLAEELAEMLREDLEHLGTIQPEIELDFDRAERRLETESFDIVVLDVNLKRSGAGRGEDPNRGRDLYQRIAAVRWVPVVFCTAYPERVRELESPPLVQVVNKSHLSEVVQAVEAGITCGVPAVTRALETQLQRHLRNFLRDVVAPRWAEMEDADRAEIGYVLVNRLSAWLKEQAVIELRGYLGTTDGTAVGTAAAARVYLYPPVTSHLTATDLVVDPDGCWWLVLTPACDLYEDPPSAARPRTAKAEYVRVARADIAEESPVVAAFLQGQADRNKLDAVFRTDSNRFMYLPHYLTVPDLLVDFENVKSIPLGEARAWQRVATLDSPYAEAALAAHSRAVGRIGTPDISADRVKAELRAQAQRRREGA